MFCIENQLKYQGTNTGTVGIFNSKNNVNVERRSIYA